MKHITAAHLDTILAGISGPFDTHDLQHQVLRRYPHEFARELLEHRDVTVFSNQFALWFDRQFRGATGKVRKTRPIESKSLVGTIVKNQGWEKASELPQS